MRACPVVRCLAPLFVLTLLAGCGGTAAPLPPTPTPLSSANVNLIFVVSEDLAFQASGDMNPNTGNLTNQGLQRSLRLASFLKDNVLGRKNVTGIYALEPMTHLQTANQYPDMVALESMQQFAMLNQIDMSDGVEHSYIGNSYPINASYGPGSVPSGVAQPSPLAPCTNCQGLDFQDVDNNNEKLVDNIIQSKAPGFYVFSAPWETTRSLLAAVSSLKVYHLSLPAAYTGPNQIYAISVTPAGSAYLTIYNANLDPPSYYPLVPPETIVNRACNAQTHFHITVTGGQDGAVIPAGINTNETLYMVRHAEAHPESWWEEGNYVAAGQWRALDLPNALRGKIKPNLVYSIDPAQIIPSNDSAAGSNAWSYVRPALTIAPYAIANGLPYNLAASFDMIDQNPPHLSTVASDFFFQGGKFSNQTLLVAWEHDHIPPTVNALLTSYHGGGTLAPNWPDDDYDTIWTITLDSVGNVTVDNAKCEGIQSSTLPSTAPQF